MFSPIIGNYGGDSSGEELEQESPRPPFTDYCTHVATHSRIGIMNIFHSHELFESGFNLKAELSATYETT